MSYYLDRIKYADSIDELDEIIDRAAEYEHHEHRLLHTVRHSNGKGPKYLTPPPPIVAAF